MSSKKVAPENRDGFFADAAAELACVRGKLEHEDTLIDHRLSWLTTSQAFLAAAYMIRFTQGSTAPVGVEIAVPVIGIASSVCIYLSIHAALTAYKTMRITWCRSHPGAEAILLADERTLSPGNAAARLLPFIFIAAWTAAFGYEIAALVNQ